VQATEVTRMGNPPNPHGLFPGETWGPVVGEIWDPLVTQFVPGSFATFIGLDFGGPINFSMSMGTLLIKPPQGRYTWFNFSPGTRYSLSVPMDCTLVGVPAWCQGACVEVGPTITLSNALDIVFGTY
jgi:hypothetical protein